jgi:hypothetical protein
VDVIGNSIEVRIQGFTIRAPATSAEPVVQGSLFLGASTFAPTLTLVGNTIERVGDGPPAPGAIGVDARTQSAVKLVAVANRVRGHALGIHCKDRCELTNNVVSGNGDGVRLDFSSGTQATMRFAHNTIASNSGTGVVCVSASTPFRLKSSIVWGNGSAGACLGDDASIVQSDAGVPDPLLTSDGHLGPGSPCIDRAPAPSPPVAFDIDLEPRPAGSAYDCGADEVH